MSQDIEGHVPPKRRRITRACDLCHRSCLKCAPGPTPASCQPCASRALTCTFERPVKRRGPSVLSRASNTALKQPQSLTADTLGTASTIWKYTKVADEPIITYLLEQYHQIVYPILLYFHWPSFSSDVKAKRYEFDRSFFALTMAVCATALTRLPEGLPAELSQSNPQMQALTSNVFYTACNAALPALIADEVEFNFMRTEALLGMLCLEHDDIRGCHAHLHRYLAMCAETGFNDEEQWPSDLNEIEIQERRRLFWQQYHFDVYLATVFGSVIRHRGQSQCRVLYPAEVYDDCDITESEVIMHGEQYVSFIQGWNFVTSLYRMLEQFLDHANARVLEQDRPDDFVTQLFFKSSFLDLRQHPSASEALAKAQQMYNALPAALTQASPATGDIQHDRYGSQAVNAIITLATVKMVFLRIEDHSVTQLCEIAGNLLDELSTIPTAYMQSTSTAMVSKAMLWILPESLNTALHKRRGLPVLKLHHIAGVGYILGRIINAPLSQWTYIQVRSALLAMADLIGSLERVMKAALGIAAKLRHHVERIDNYMSEVANQRRLDQVMHSAMPLTGIQRHDKLLISNESVRNVNRMQLQSTAVEADEAQSTDAFAQNRAELNNPDKELETGVETNNYLSNVGWDSDVQFQLPPEFSLEWLEDFGDVNAFAFLG